MLASSGACTSAGDLRGSTVEAAERQLEAAERSGFRTQIVAPDEPIDAREALERAGDTDPEVTYLVLTRNDAQIDWGGRLRADPPAAEAAILGAWVVPYLEFGDRDTALKAMVFGYLRALHDAGRIEWSTAVVPFLPAGPRSMTENTFGWGWALALLGAIAVLWATWKRS